MSEAEFYWTLAEPPEAKRIEVSSPGIFSIHMERAFPQGFPMTLTEKDLPILNGMAATWSDVSVSPYVILARNIQKYKKILVYMKYTESLIEERAEEAYLETGKRPGE